ncbi:hypothetical protein CCS01_29800 [Rhodopila globiformis]|uniref:Glycosyltransferase RgtA/B/C/D-like domain-containing protein n=2 Tax=Rhodopila globiformis TaxID=1071 RepID=A0A2S6MW15_RHOGL|nr:hypothetical protein CCS01_29800 [Rhodopila globiformis]
MQQSKHMPIALAALAYAVFLFSPSVLNDGDTWLHIAVGRWILEHGTVPVTDAFSYTFAGAPWRAQEWLSELLMALAWRLDGVDGVLILYGAAVALTVWLLARHLQTWFPPLLAVIVTIYASLCGAGSALARPHLLAVPALELWVAGLALARTRERPPSPWLLPVMTLWANLHGSFVFGLLLVVPFGLEAVFATKTPDWHAARSWALFLAAGIAASMLTPYGWHSLVMPFHLMRLQHLTAISEWQSPDFNMIQPAEIALFALLLACLLHGRRISLFRLLILLGMLHMSLQHVRHFLVAGIVLPLALAEPLSRGGVRGDAFGAPVAIHGAVGRNRLPGLAGLGLLALVTVLRLGTAAVPHDGPMSPLSALQHVPAALRTKPVLNDCMFGSFMIYEGFRPFVDGRAELYRDKFIELIIDIDRPDSAVLQRTLASRDIAWTILSPSNPASAVMDMVPGWKRLYADEYAIIYVRGTPTS